MFELRMYDVAVGRAGDMVDRMAKGLLPLFARHGVPLAGYWLARTGARLPRFYYLMAWPDDAERRRCWGKFYEDPEWAELRRRTNAGSELVERGTFVFMDPLGGTAVEPRRCTQPIYRLSALTLGPGATARAREAVVERVEPAMQAMGGEVLMLWNVISGAGLPALMHLSAWHSAGDAIKFEACLEADERLRAWITRDRETNGASALVSWDSCLLEAPESGRPNVGLTSIVARGIDSR